MFSSGTAADIQVLDGNPDKERHAVLIPGGAFGGINLHAFAVEHTVTRILIRALLRVLQDLVRSLLGLGVRPCFSDAVPVDRLC